MTNNRVKLETEATNTVQKNGLSNLSFRTLAEKVGIKSSSVHYYFPEKSDLANRILDKYTQELDQRLESLAKSAMHPQKKLSKFVNIFDDVAKAEKFCLCGMLAAEIENLDNSTVELLKLYFTKAEDWLHQLFTDNQDQLTINLTPKQLSRLVISGLEGALLIDRVYGRKDRLTAHRKFIEQLIIQEN